MRKIRFLLELTGLAVLTACGGGGGGDGNGGSAGADSFTQAVQSMIATESDMAEPVSIDGIVVVEADSAEPVPVS